MAVKGSVTIALASAIFLLTLCITYTLAVLWDHVEPVWPYISYTGDRPVESCFFSLGLNVVAALYCVVVYFRWFGPRVRNSIMPMAVHSRRRMLFTFCTRFLTQPNRFDSLMNRSSLAWGEIASMALSMTASFQESNTPVVHLLSALTCSYTALIYFWHQTYFSYKYVRRWIPYGIAVFRAVLCLSSTVIHLTAPVLYFYLTIYHPRTHDELMRWKPSEAGYGVFVAGSAMEWIIFLINEMYIMSLFCEFQDIRFRLGEIAFVRIHYDRGES